MTEKPKILLYDIEASNLNADFGFIFCICYKFLDEKKVHTISIRDFPGHKKDPTCDRSVLLAFKHVYEKAHVAVGHYASRFDRPYINSRLGYYKLSPLPNIAEFDPWKTSKYQLKLSSNRLETINRFFKTKIQKTPIEGRAWVRAVAGHIPSLKQIELHCQHDVLSMEESYERIKPFSVNHPNLSKILNLKDACPLCGSKNTRRNGIGMKDRKPYQKFQCKDCYHPFKGKLEK